MSTRAFGGWAAYEDAVVDVEFGDGTVTLGREGVIAGNSSALGTPLFVITAFNPGRVASTVDNEAAQGRLRHLLATRAVTSYSAVGRSRDRLWQEPSVAVADLSESEAIEIGSDFNQDAVFGWDGQTLRVISCKLRDN